jgi:UDP-N-acetylmuramoyl-tripeptide--D-alanyl-D-alanine ligase
MYKLTASEITKITEGQMTSGDPQTLISGYAIDSSSLKKGDLFLPLKGANTDGHTYIKDAVKKGAAGYLYSHGEPIESAFAIKGKVIAITGRTGKTTTKDFIVSILSRKYKTASSPMNFNTEIGLPLTILRFEDDAEVLVVEMGMRGMGQIKLLAHIAKPDIGLITNISKTHIELLGSEENIAKAKGELIEALDEEKLVLLNSKDKWTPYLVDKAKCQVETYGLSSNKITAKQIELDEMAMPSFKIIVNGLCEEIKLKIPGKHNVMNALAAAAVSLKMGLTLKDIAAGLEQAVVSDWRMEIKKNGDILVISDYYNASPQSVEAAIEMLSEINHGRRKIAILGDMLELGSISADEHIKVVKKALNNADEVLLVGKNMKNAAVVLGIDKVFNNSHDLSKEISRYILPGDVILLKASRAMSFEHLETKIMEEEHAFS